MLSLIFSYRWSWLCSLCREGIDNWWKNSVVWQAWPYGLIDNCMIILYWYFWTLYVIAGRGGESALQISRRPLLPCGACRGSWQHCSIAPLHGVPTYPGMEAFLGLVLFPLLFSCCSGGVDSCKVWRVRNHFVSWWYRLQRCSLVLLPSHLNS